MKEDAGYGEVDREFGNIVTGGSKTIGNTQNELNDPTEEVIRQNIESAPSLLLACDNTRGRGELLNTREPGLTGLENQTPHSQPLKDGKTGLNKLRKDFRAKIKSTESL